MRSRTTLAVCALAGLPLLGCSKAPPAAAPASAPAVTAPAAPSATAPAVPPAAPAPAIPTAAPPAPPEHPKDCEVEMIGDLKVPPLAAGEHVFAYVAQDSDCLAKDAHIIGSNKVTDDGHMFIEVFSRWGADLTVCAAISKELGAPTTVYGKAEGKFHAEAVGEIMIPKISFELKKGPKHVFPAPRPALPPAPQK